MHLKTIKMAVIWTVSLLLALLCLGWLPLLPTINKTFSVKDNPEIILSGKEYNSTTSTEPTVVTRGSDKISSSIDLRFRFCIRKITPYQNIFQTANHEDGMRFEIFSTAEEKVHGAIIYGKGGKIHVFKINNDLEIDKPYVLALRTEKTAFVSVYLNNEHIGDFQDDLMVFSDFLLGSGFDSSRTFSGYVDLEYGTIILAGTIEKTIAWLKLIFTDNIFQIIGYLFLIISILALMKICEFVFYENGELPLEHGTWKNWDAVSMRIDRNPNVLFLILFKFQMVISLFCKKWDAVSTRIDRIPNSYFLILFKLQIIISLYSVAKYSWKIGDLINKSSRLYWGYGLYEWTTIFYHPFGGHIFNYFVLCIFMGLYGLVIYALINNKNIKRIEEASNNEKSFLIFIFFISLIILPKTFILKNNPALRSFIVAFFPLLYAFVLKYKNNIPQWLRLLSPKTLFQKIARAESRQNRYISIHMKKILSLSFVLNKRFLLFITLLLLFFVCLEPLNLFNGPVYLLNEYDIPDDVYMNGVLVNNDDYLNNLQDHDSTVISAITEVEPISRKNWQMEPMRNIAMSTVFSNRLTAGDAPSAKDDKSMSKNPVINSEGVKEFYINNYFEYIYYNSSRGQMNHVGHVLNPLNEYQLGKPIRDIYLQYGIGYTFLLKWTMELFGGISIENYYKCYIYYVIYSFLFLLMTIVLFENSLYTAVSFAVLCSAYYFQTFIAFTLAPGIIPAIHLFDVFVVSFLVFYFRKSNPLYLVLAVLSAFAGIVMNKQFGSILTVALTISILLYSLESIEKKEKRLGLLITSITIVLAAIVSHFTATGALGETFPYFLTGLFSWPANHIIISLTLIYISISYVFFFLLKDCRHYLKYVYVMVSIYTQGLFLYYYWSGLSNHLPTVIPFLGLQLLLIVFITQNILFKDKERLRTLLIAALKVAFVILMVIIVHYSLMFYRQKSFFMNNFVKHAAYSWNFKKANIVTTINPIPIQESISLIQRYSPQDKGIFILSKYDNLLPFLANRYSKMPFFEMTWHLLSEKESRETIEMIRAAEPEYLFYDTNLANNALYDRWSKLFYGPWEPERDSRLGRYRELQKVFESVSIGYSLVEKGALISVYQRNARISTGKL